MNRHVYAVFHVILSIAALKRRRKSVRRKVQSIVDGDTFKVRRRVAGSQFIRMAGMDAPERGYGLVKKRLFRLRGKTVTIRPKGKSYGRTVADVIFKRKRVK